MATDPRNRQDNNEPDDITSMMYVIGGLLLASMVVGYFVAM